MSALDSVDDVGHDAGAGAREHGSGAAEAGEYLVEDQQHLVTVGEQPQPAQRVGVVKAHAAGALDQRFDDDPGDVVDMSGDEPVQLRGAVIVARQVAHVMPRQQGAEHAVHAVFRIRHRHGAGGVAVIGAAEGDELGAAAHAFVEPVLHRHLHRDFDRDRSGIGEEHAVESRHQRAEAPRQRQRALMDEAAEHHVGHDVELALHRGGDLGMIIAVAGGPPRRDAVDQFRAVGEDDAAAARRLDRQRCGRGLHLRIGQPDVGQVIPIRRAGRAGGAFFA